MPTYETPGPITATVRLPIGELRVVASDRTDTTVEVRADSADRDYADRIHVELTGDDLRVTGPALGLLQKLTPRTPGRSVLVEIGLPTGSAVTASTGYGSLSAEGRFGHCALHSDYGDVRVDDATSAELSAGYGQIRVTGTVDGDVTARSDHGGLRLERIGGRADLRSTYSAIRAGTVAGTAELTGSHGDIEIDGLEGDVRVRTAHGNVRLGRVHRGEVSLTSTHGRIDVGIGADSAAWLDLDTSGRVRNALAPREDPGGFAETVSVHARSREGDIVIRRA